METKDHLYLARLITSEADLGGRLKNSAFEYGCISPDINLSPISRVIPIPLLFHTLKILLRVFTAGLNPLWITSTSDELCIL